MVHKKKVMKNSRGNKKNGQIYRWHVRKRNWNSYTE